MALDATELLDAAQIAGVKVNSRGMGKSVAAPFSGMYTGVVGAGIGAAKGLRAGQEQAAFAAASDTPKFGKLAYLVVTADEVALIAVKSKVFTVYLSEVITRVPRGEVASVEFGGGGMYSDPLTVTFASGANWALEVPKPSRKSAKEFVAAIER